MQTNNTQTTITNDRLAKAIERNRARQLKKSNVKTKLNNTFSKNEPSLFDRSNFSQNNKLKVVRPGATRSGVARADTVKFNSNIESRVDRFSSTFGKGRRATSIKRSPKKILSPSKFSLFSNRGGKLTKKRKEKFVLKIMWMICLALSVRLVFTDGGILDFHNQKNVISQVKLEINQVDKNNDSLINELKLIKTSRSYRKELVRKHLGFISSNEYLVLFAENTVNN